MIKLLVIGNLGKDCIVNTVNGKNVINFSVAHTEKFKEQDKTIWVECAYWTDKTAIAPYLKKGTQVYVEGSPEVRNYETKDGKQGSSLSLRVNNVQLLGSRGGGESGGENSGGGYQQNQPAYSKPSGGGYQTTSAGNENDASDDLPF